MSYTEPQPLQRLRTAEELLKEAAELTQQAEELKAQEKNEAIARIRDLMKVYGINPIMLGTRKAPAKPVVKRKLPPKYRDPISGVTWAGRGKTPKWVTAYIKAGYGVLSDLEIRNG